MSDNGRLDQLITATDAWFGGAPVPPWFDPAPGETIYAVVEGVELLELRKTQPPLTGGTSTVDLARIEALADAARGTVRSVWLQEDAPARDVGTVLLTSARVLFHGARDRSWLLRELEDLVHDTNVPETWMAVESRKRVSGIRYPAAAALQLRFTVALVMATARDERPALRAWLAGQRAAPQHTAAVVIPEQPAAAASVSAGSGPVRKVLSTVYLGKKGMPVGLRATQGLLAGLATLALIGSVLPEEGSRSSDVAAAQAASSRPADASATEAAGEAQQAADDAERAEAARQAAEAEAAAEAARQAQEEAAAAEAARVAGEEEAARVAAEEQAAAEAARAGEAAAAEAAQAQLAPQSLAAPPPAADSGAGCMADYPDFCIPVGPDLDCPDINGKNFTVLEPDSYRLDGNDDDGIGCET